MLILVKYIKKWGRSTSARQVQWLIFLVALASLTGACSDQVMWWEPLPPGTIVMERASTDHKHTAILIAQQEPGSYMFEIRDARTREPLISRMISAPGGYHTHLITLDWNLDGEYVTATIDYDFGDGNRVFRLDR